VAAAAAVVGVTNGTSLLGFFRIAVAAAAVVEQEPQIPPQVVGK
jgi:hypothetical protein